MEFLWLLEGIRTPLLDKFMQAVTWFGQEMLIIVIICLIYWCIDKPLAYQLGFTYFTAGLCVQALKITCKVPRPWVLDPAFHAVESALPGATGYSFPSGHTQGAVSLFMPLLLRAKRLWVKILCALAFLLVGFSRMYLGCHTPADVFASTVISIFFALLVWRFRRFLLEDHRHLREIGIVLAIFSALIAAYALFLLNSGSIETKYAADCCKAAGAGLGFSVGWYLERTKLNFSPKTPHVYQQCLKLIAGLIAAFALKEGISFILGTSILAKMMEYFILVLWVLVLYPALFSRLLTGKRQPKKDSTL